MIATKFKEISVNEIIKELKIYKVCFIKILESCRIDFSRALLTQILVDIDDDIVNLNTNPSKDYIQYTRINLTNYDNVFRNCIKGLYL